MKQFCNFEFALSSFSLCIVLVGLMVFLSSAIPVIAQSQQGRSLDSELLKNLKTHSKNDIEREALGAGEKGKADKLQNKTGQGGVDLDEQLQRELGAAAEKEDDNPLLNIARTMSQVRQRMAQIDAGPTTLNLQKQIIADLDLVLDKARKSAGQCSSGSCNSQKPSSQKPSDSPPKPGANAGKKPGSKPATSSSPQPPDGQSHKPDMEERRAMMDNLWGELPQHVREQMLQSPVEEFVPKYEQLIEDYFRDLSTEKKSGE
jgi:hypothetical protein